MEQTNDKYNELIKVSNPKKVYQNAIKYFDNKDFDLQISNHKYKKYKILNPNTNKYIHFGDIRYKDFTYTNDKDKQKAYLSRATKIKGDWKDNIYSPNNLSINLLW